ncbi:response regulator [Niveibacterium sp. SC-1]|uniref:response regulator n=1 Tax=Niveibacterium sp. SC-1 TaxID=3135646 RepID=UPI00311F9420
MVPRVVILEDDASLRLALQRLCEASGLTTAAVESAEALLPVPELREGDCYVLDLHLPGVSGLEVARALRTQRPRVPILLISAYDDALSRQGCSEVGADAWMSKPFAGADLIDWVRTALQLPPEAPRASAA